MGNKIRLIDVNDLPRNVWLDGSILVMAVAEIDNAPTVDAAPVVHSMWRFNKDGSGTCQHCNRTSLNVWDYDRWMNYCPSCGARMDGEPK